jgi:NAD(P)-dependent dehydrogenase (short-subunit alcohol dehydrogenase family)
VLKAKVASLPEGSATYYAGDVASPEDAKAMVEKTVEFGGAIDILVNNAGIDPVGLVTEIELEDWARVMDTNLNGPFLLARFTIPYMLERGVGSIVNVASIAGIRNIPAMPAYSTSKAGLIGLSSSIAFDHGKDGIRSNVVCPGGTHTEMTDKTQAPLAKLLETDGAGVEKYMTQYLPIPRSGLTSEMAAAILFFASDESAYVTGTVLPVDGGACIVDPVSAAIRNVSDRWGG